MIILRRESQTIEVARAESYECFTAFELEIDLIADVALEPVHLVGGIYQYPYTGIAWIGGHRRYRACGRQPGGNTRDTRGSKQCGHAGSLVARNRTHAHAPMVVNAPAPRASPRWIRELPRVRW
jgi:hypothetical protein